MRARRLLVYYCVCGGDSLSPFVSHRRASVAFMYSRNIFHVTFATCFLNMIKSYRAVTFQRFLCGLFESPSNRY